MYINIVNAVKANTTWFMKKNGTNWGMFRLIFIDIIFNISDILYINTNVYITKYIGIYIIKLKKYNLSIILY